MEMKIAALVLVTLHLVSNFENSDSYVINGPKIVTYGEPCIPEHKLPIKIERPRPPVEKSFLESLILEQDSLRGKSYGYNINVPPTSQVQQQKCEHHNFEVHIPPPSPQAYAEYIEERKPVQYLTGLRAKIDRVLVPACEVPPTNC